ncbi:MAG: C4-dicarboxylate ABC transporter, partial [Pseudoclavibacter sp.]|nr:C4-dicarboxylate ABC transporter [Pseudoclavibacter sp.]
LLGEQAALGLDLTLWTIGTLIGLVTAVSVPVLLFLREGNAEDAAFGGWLMPVVPPMVSASAGAAIVPHLPAGEARTDLLAACAMLFGATIVPALLIMGQLWARLVRHGPGPAAMVPTLWIVLGPLGQSATAAMGLGRAAGHVLPEGLADTARLAGLVYAAPVMGTALLWMAIAASLTVRQLRRGMPFALTWWSFTFPVGTCVTGASGLAEAAGTGALRALAVAMYLGLVAAWGIVFVRTVHGALRSGRLLAPPA